MYKPNFDDPRTQRRVKKALGWARAVLSTTEGRGWSTRYIDRYLGHQGNDLSQYLRHHLLITTNNHWNKDQGICKSYVLNIQGYDWLRDCLLKHGDAEWQEYQQQQPQDAAIISTEQYDYWLIKTLIQREYGLELKNLAFNYKDQSQRLWHPIQNIRRCYKQQILKEAGLTYNYDIQTAAPTLLLQLAQQLGQDQYLFAVNNYIKNKKQIRQSLAEELELEVKDIKVIITALFCGARLGLNPDFAISELIKNDPARLIYLKQDQFIKDLRADIKLMWDQIELSMTKITYKDKNNNERKLPLSSRRKWQKYFELERSVLTAINDYLVETDNPCFLEHDGFVSKEPVDIPLLQQHIHQRTGFLVDFDRENF